MKSRTIKRSAKVLFVIITCIVIIGLTQRVGMENIRVYIDSSGKLKPILIFLLRSLSILIPALPSTIYSLMAGSLLGLKNGLITIYLADFISCTICFMISRILGRRIVTYVIGARNLIKLEKFSRKNLEGNPLIIIGFLMTGLFDFISYGLGLTRISWKKFLLCLMTSVLISDLPVVAIGAGILEEGKRYLILGVVGFIALGLISAKTGIKQKLQLR